MLKQNLKIKTFVGTSANAVRTQIWTALICMLLLRYLQLRSRFGWSMANLVALLRMNLFTHHEDDYLRWDEWDSLDIPVLCLRGESSDLLLPETADAMRQRGPRAVVVTIPGCGHAPALNTPQQYALVERFLVGH